MKESEIQKQIIDLLRAKGFFVWKNHSQGVRGRNGARAKTHSAGLPDICAIKDGFTHFIEVKTPTGTLNDDQVKWHKEALEHGVIVHIARSVEDAINIFGGS